MKKTLDILGTITTLISLAGLPWYQIRARITQDVWYVFSYSPFRLVIDLGQSVDSEYFYRYDTSMVGILLLSLIIIRLYKNKSKRAGYLAPLGMVLMVLFFVTLLPIHVTTARRLTLGVGTYLVLIGSTILFTSNFSHSILTVLRRLGGKFMRFPTIFKIFIFSNIAYLIIRYILILII
jgi:hypothetical protein